jgi:hypothetical protein
MTLRYFKRQWFYFPCLQLFLQPFRSSITRSPRFGVREKLLMVRATMDDDFVAVVLAGPAIRGRPRSKASRKPGPERVFPSVPCMRRVGVSSPSPSTDHHRIVGRRWN